MTSEQSKAFEEFCVKHGIPLDNNMVHGIKEVAKAAFVAGIKHSTREIKIPTWDELRNGGRLRQ